ncbi:hypothetical protein BTHE68_40580 [Burkholderia sp. THE68]|nr:hypothetical protein BTHE68_40580 [Burkholderia sp. THE68]
MALKVERFNGNPVLLKVCGGGTDHASHISKTYSLEIHIGEMSNPQHNVELLLDHVRDTVLKLRVNIDRRVSLKIIEDYW